MSTQVNTSMNQLQGAIAYLKQLQNQLSQNQQVSEQGEKFLTQFTAALEEGSTETKMQQPEGQTEVKLSEISYLVDDRSSSRARKPSVKEFMDATGLSFNDAGALIGIGAAGHADQRDWDKIMESSDPAQALSIANGQQFNSSTDWDPYASKNNGLDPNRVVAKSGNFLLYRETANINGTDYLTLQITDGAGRILTQAGVSAEQIAKNTWLYGMKSSDLKPLIAHAESFNSGLVSSMKEVTKADI